MSGLYDVRDALATALEAANVQANVYAYAPETVSTPAVLMVPADPFMVLTGFTTTGVRLRYRLQLTAAVAMLDNAGALENLEDLVLQMIAALPSGTAVGDVAAPRMTQVGSSDLLTTDVTVEVNVLKENP